MKKKLMGAVILGVASLIGCMDGEECEVEARAEGGSVIECPGEAPVVTEQPVPSGTKCQARGDKIVCTSGQEFEVAAEEEGEPGRDRDGGGLDVEEGDVDGTGGDGIGNLGVSSTPWESSCEAAGERVVCRDGTKATVADLEEEATCRSTMVPGVGRRIVCDDGTQVRPEEGSAEGVEITCERRQLENGKEVISCSDGAFASADALPEGCEPTSRREGDQVVVGCGTFETELETRCTGTVLIESKEDLEEFEEARCYAVWGDFIVRNTQIEDISPLDTVQFVAGTLAIVDNAHLLSFGPGNVYRVGGDLVVRNNPELRQIGPWGPLWGVEGYVEFSANEKVEWIEARPKYWVGGSWAIGGHEELEAIGEWDGADRRVYFQLPPAYIEETFMFVDNTSFGVCKTQAVWEWARPRAEAVYIGNNGKWGNLEQCPESF